MRRNWKFNYKGSDLLEPTKKKVEHHAERLAFWREELMKAQTELKEKGIVMREHQMTGSHQRQEAVLDQGLQYRVSECHGKTEEHRKLHEDYERYVRAFELNPESELELDIDDIAYFGL